jgi:PAS domain S-box-containing protein
MGGKKKHVDGPANVTETILESISEGVFTVDHNWRITSFNRAAEDITGIRRDEAIGRHCWEVFRSNMCERDCALKKTMKVGKSFVSSSTYIINRDKKKIPISVSTSVLKDGNGKILGGVETFRDHSLVEELRKELSSRFRLEDMVSRSESLKKIFSIVPQVAESSSTVLIQGETGTGKELLARAIHNLSHRKSRPFVAINCGALPDTLLESELFGYKKGAFTHAEKDKPGHFAMAGGGTVFLDEIGDTSQAFQVKLLRVLEEQEYMPLGAVKTEKADVRIIAATHRDLSSMADAGSFRRDLFYRINVVRLSLPPLRERMEDIPLLADRFIHKMNRLRGKSVNELSRRALERLMAHDYPGNIRELENIIEHAFILCSEGDIDPRHLPAWLWDESSGPGEAPDEYGNGHDPVAQAERKHLIDTLNRHGQNREAAARALGIHKATLYRKMKKLSIPLPETDGRRR